jgi:ATP-binding cassette subfamily C protein
VAKAIKLLTWPDRKKLLIITFSQIAIGFLDLAAITVLGALGALSVQGIESHKAGNKVSSLLNFLRLENVTFRSQVATLGIFAIALLITKTISSIFFMRKTFFFLSWKTSEIAADLLSNVLQQNLDDLQKRSSQQIVYSLAEGVKNILIGILGTAMTIVADASLLLVITVGLFIIDPVAALLSTILISFSGLVLYNQLSTRSGEFGKQAYLYSVQSNEKTLEVLSTYREAVVRNRRQYYVEEIKKIRSKLSDVNAELSFQPYISKFAIEIVSVLALLVLAGFEFGTKNAVHAVSVLAVFMAGISRVTPAALRIQQGFLTIKNSSGSTASTIDLIYELRDQEPVTTDISDPDYQYANFNSQIIVSKIKFKYLNSDKFAINDVSLTVDSGTTLAIVGPSGGGKSTLIDLILGILVPMEGHIYISGVSPADASKKWSGAISYIPQNVSIVSGTIRNNVGMGYSSEAIDEKWVWKALDEAQLSDFVLGLPEGINSDIGERGEKLSGGQRQRLGLARALFTQPKLLVMDEATSALDGQTEALITNAFSKLSGKVTVIIVAHRLSTVKNADKVVYLDHGEIKAMGTFAEVRNQVSDFDEQAKLMNI